MSNETVSIRSKVIDVVKSRMEMTRDWLVRIEAHDSDDDTQMFMGEMLHIIVDGHRELNQLQVDDLEQKKEQLLNVLSNLPTTDNISNEENFALFRSIRTATNELGMQVYDLITTLQVLIRGQPKEVSIYKLIRYIQLFSMGLIVDCQVHSEFSTISL